MNQFKYALFNNLSVAVIVAALLLDRFFHLQYFSFLIAFVLVCLVSIYRQNVFFPKHSQYDPKQHMVTKVANICTLLGLAVYLAVLLLTQHSSISFWPFILLFSIVRDYFSPLKTA